MTTRISETRPRQAAFAPSSAFSPSFAAAGTKADDPQIQTLQARETKVQPPDRQAIIEQARLAWEPAPDQRHEEYNSLYDRLTNRVDLAKLKIVAPKDAEIIGTFRGMIIIIDRAELHLAPKLIRAMERSIEEIEKTAEGQKMMAEIALDKTPTLIRLSHNVEEMFTYRVAGWERSSQLGKKFMGNYDELTFYPLIGVVLSDNQMVPPWLFAAHEFFHRWQDAKSRVASLENAENRQDAAFLKAFPYGDINYQRRFKKLSTEESFARIFEHRIAIATGMDPRKVNNFFAKRPKTFAEVDDPVTLQNRHDFIRPGTAPKSPAQSTAPHYYQIDLP